MRKFRQGEKERDTRQEAWLEISLRGGGVFSGSSGVLSFKLVIVTVTANSENTPGVFSFKLERFETC